MVRQTFPFQNQPPDPQSLRVFLSFSLPKNKSRKFKDFTIQINQWFDIRKSRAQKWRLHWGLNFTSDFTMLVTMMENKLNG